MAGAMHGETGAMSGATFETMLVAMLLSVREPEPKIGTGGGGVG